MRGSHFGIRVVVLAFLCAALISAPLPGASAQTWKHRTRGEREQGELKGVSLMNDGTLALGPALESLASVADPYLWALARDSRGNIYAGSGNEGKVYRLGRDGRFSLLFDSPELEVHALAVDSQDNLYAGTSPRGKIYRVDPSGRVAEFFSPGETYIWALAFDRRGNLYAGTGTEGKVYRVTPSGKGEVLLDTDETHVRVLALASDGGLIAGTDGKGLLLRIGDDGKSTVITDAPLGEITAVVLGAGGRIYFSAAGQVAVKRGPQRPSAAPAPQQAAAQPSPEQERVPGQPPPEPPQPAPQQPQAAPPSPPPPGTGVESRIVLVEADGYSREIWSGTGDLVLSLALDPAGNVIAGTGIDGKIYRINPVLSEATLLTKADSAQVTALLSEPGGSLLASCANLGALYRLGGGVATEGTFESAPFDARVFSSWGRISWKGETPPGSSIGIQVRTGKTADPDATWSGWSPVYEKPGTLIERPRARYVQWRAVLKSDDGRAGPLLGEVTVNYLQRNLPPEIKSVEIQSPGVVFQRPNKSGGSSATPAEGAGGSGRAGDRERPSRRLSQQPRPRNEADGRAVQWTAVDPNGDDLRYSVHYRGVEEKEWKLMEKDLTDPFFSWDATSMADGTYLLRVVAEDAPSNPPGASLSAERLSEPFDVDNNPPRIGPIRASVSGPAARIEFEVADSFSNLGPVEYSVNAGEWWSVHPVDGISDSIREDYRVDLPGLPAGETVVVVRAGDEAGNSATAKVLLRVAGSR